MSIVEIEGTGRTQSTDGLPKTIITSQSLPVVTSVSDDSLLATHGRTFNFAARFLPMELRQPVVTLYAFFRTLDDLVDEPPKGHQIQDIRQELLAWKEWLKGECVHPAPREPLGAKLAAVLAERPVPTTILLDFLAGLDSDLELREVDDFCELYRYCYRVAGTVGLAMAHILGVNSTQALATAQSLGIAMQLTNILRDVGSDLAAGRIYLPREELERFGSSRNHLLQLLKNQRGPDERFRNLMRYQVTRAHRYYARGMPGIWMLPTDRRLPILIAGRLYRRILTVIEHREYDVLRARAATNFSEKVREAIIAFTLDRLWRRGEALPALEAEVLFEG